MVRFVKIMVFVLACVVAPSAFGATAGSHYPFGVEGVMAGSAPPPGFHYRIYNVFYNPDTMTDNNGDALPIGFELDAFATAHRFVYVSNKKILGGNWFANVIVPFVDKDITIEAAGVSESQSLSLGDMTFEPFAINWNGPRWDAAAAIAVIAPTGEYNSTEPASVGMGYWSTMFTIGGTYYFDEPKSWTVSALTRTLMNGEQDETDITPGSEFVVEYGLGKQLQAGDFLIRPGFCGYAYWQLSEDDGTDDDTKKRSFAVGGEVNFLYLPYLLQVNLRYVDEFNTENNSESDMFVLTLTKSF